MGFKSQENWAEAESLPTAASVGVVPRKGRDLHYSNLQMLQEERSRAADPAQIAILDREIENEDRLLAAAQQAPNDQASGWTGFRSQTGGAEPAARTVTASPEPKGIMATIRERLPKSGTEWLMNTLGANPAMGYLMDKGRQAEDERKAKNVSVMGDLNPLPQPKVRAPDTRAGPPSPTVERSGGGSTLAELPGAMRRFMATAVPGVGRFAGEVGAKAGVPGAQWLADRSTAALQNIDREEQAAQNRSGPVGENEIVRNKIDKGIKAVENNVLPGLAQAGALIPGIVASVASRSPAPALASIAATTGPKAYHDYREAGLGIELAALGAIGQTVAEVAPESIVLRQMLNAPIGQLIRGTPAQRAAAVGYLTKMSGMSLASEEVSTISNFLVDAGLKDPTATLGRLLDDMKQTAAQMVTQGPLMAGTARTARSLPALARGVQERVDPRGAIADELRRVLDEGPVSSNPMETQARVIPGNVPPPAQPPEPPPTLTEIGRQVRENTDPGALADFALREDAADPPRWNLPLPTIADEFRVRNERMGRQPLPTIELPEDPAPAEAGPILPEQIFDRMGEVPGSLDPAYNEPEERLMVARRADEQADTLRERGFEVRGTKIVGAPPEIDSLQKLNGAVKRMVNLASSPYAVDKDSDWYKEVGRMINQYAHDDAVLKEQLTRLVAKLSQAQSVGGNATQLVKTAYQLARGEMPAAGRFPNQFRKEIAPILSAKDVDTNVPGVNLKLRSFYRNIYDEVHGSNKYPDDVTIDRHMYRLVFNHDAKASGGDTQYNFGAKVVRLATDAYNKAHGTNIKPRQLQAILWGAHMNRTSGKKGPYAPARNYPDYIEPGVARVTAETVPSTSTAAGKAIVGQSAEQKLAFTEQAYEVVRQGGQDQIAQKLGLPLYQNQYGTGGYGGSIQPNVITGIVPTYDGGGKWSAKQADLYALAWQFIYRQDAVPWFRADPSLKVKTKGSVARGYQITFKAPLTPEVEQRFYDVVRSTLGDDAGFTKINPTTVAMINYRGDDGLPFAMPDKDFDSKLSDIVDSQGDQLGFESIVDFGAETAYHAHDWRQDATGEQILQRIGKAGRADLHGWLRDRQAAADAVADAAAGRSESDAGNDGRAGDTEPTAAASGRGEALSVSGPPRELSKAQLKELDRTLPRPTVLPSVPAKYFQLKGSAFVPIDSLLSSKTKQENSKSAETAAKRLRAAFDGKIQKRPPVNVRSNGNGTYTILDGNATYTALKQYGWKAMPVVIEQPAGDSVEESVRALIDTAKRHHPSFEALTRDLASQVGGGAVVAPVKGYARTLVKVINDYNGDVSQLKDVLRSTIVLNDKAEIKRALDKVLSDRDSIKQRNLYEIEASGYRDALTVLPTMWGPAEVQFNTPEMLEAKGRAHLYYEAIASVESAATTADRLLTEKEIKAIELFEARMNTIYTDAQKRNEDRIKSGRVMSADELDKMGKAAVQRGAALAEGERKRIASIASNLSLEIGVASEPGDDARLPPGTSNQSTVPAESRDTGVPSASQNFGSMGNSVARQDDGGTVDPFKQLPTPAANLKITVADVASRAQAPSNLGFVTRREVNNLQRMSNIDRARTATALSALVQAGMPESIVKSIKGFVTFDDSFGDMGAAYWPETGVLGIHRSVLGGTTGKLQSYIAHELGHHVDNTNGDVAGIHYSEVFGSSKSERLVLTRVVDGIDYWMRAEGDLAQEVLDVYYDDLGGLSNYFKYPIVDLETKFLDPVFGPTEMVAQVTALYVMNPGAVREYMPKWFEVMEETYGTKDQESEGAIPAPQSIGEARQRLQAALQDGRSQFDDAQRGDGASERGGSGIENEQSAARGPPRSAVGIRVSGPPAAQSGQPPGARGNRPAVAQGGARGQWSVDDGGLKDRLTREWQNNQIDLKRVQEAIEQTSGAIQEPGNAYLAEELYRDRVSSRVKRFSNGLAKTLLNEIKNSGLTVDEAGRYLWARHAKERNAQMAKINPGGPANLSGMYDNARAAAIAGDPTALNAVDVMRQLDAKAAPGSTARIAAAVDAITKATRQILVNEGLEEADTIAAWNRAYQHYVPLFRDIDEGQGTGAGFTIKGSESKRAMGSQREAQAIIAAVLSQHQRAITRAEKAKVGRALIKLAEQHPNPSFWKVDTPPTKRTINKTTGLVQSGIDPLFRNRDDVLVVKQAGPNGTVVERTITFNENDDRALALGKAMRNLDVVQLDGLTKMVGKVTRVMASLATSWNPVFWTTNFARDVQTAAVNLQSTPLNGHAPHIMANIPRAMAGIMSAEFRNGQGTWAKHYREFEASGGKMEWISMFNDLIDQQKAIESEIKASQRGNINPAKWASLAFDTIEKTNAAVENGTRLAAYVEGRKIGLSQAQAASLAKNLTVNFRRKGNRSTATGAWYMFFNASVQGTARLIQGVVKSPKAQIMVGTMVAFSAALELINRLIGDDDRDEDDNNPYELIPEHVKQKNLILMLPGGKTASMPMPYGFNVFHNIGRMMMEGALSAGGSELVSEKKKPIDLAWNVAQVMFDSFMPLGHAPTPGQFISPSVLDPLVQYGENKTWYGSPLRPEPLPGEGAKPNHKLYFRSTSDTAKDLARWLNEVSGGDDIKGGAIDISPTTMTHAFNTITGGSGRFVLGMFDLSKHAIGRVTGEREAEDMPWRNVPFVGKFYGEVDDRDRAAKFYRLREPALDVAKQVKDYRKTGDVEKAMALEEEKPELVALARELNDQRFKRDMKEIRGRFKEVDEMPREERARARRELASEEATIMGRAVRAYNEAMREKQ